MTPTDVAGLLGVLVILLAYAGAAVGKIDPERPLSLLCNLVGASLILWSLLTQSFNLSATTMEGAWALVSFFGLVRWAWKARRRRSQAN